MQTSKKSIVKSNLRLIIIIIVLALGILVYWFYKSYYSNPKQVFYGMISNNLNTQSYVVTSEQAEIGGDLTEQTLVNSGSKNIVISREITNIDSSNSSIETLSIGTPSTDYSSYQKIGVGKSSPVYRKIIGIWGVNSPSGINGQGGQLYKSSVLSPFLFASPSVSDTHKLVSFIKQNKVYTIKTSKRGSVNDRPVINYEIGVNLKQYSKLLDLYAGLIGYKNTNQSISYSSNQTANLDISVDILSRQLVGLSYLGSNSIQIYQSYGIKSPIKLPSKTVSLQSLKNTITALSKQ